MREEVIGDQRLILGDCREVVPGIGAVDAVVTDPPYGAAATHANHLSGVTLADGTRRQDLGFDGISGEDLVALAASWVSIARRWVVFTCEWKDAHLLDSAGLLIRLGIWRKPDGAPQFTGDRPGMGWEAVAICHRKGRKRWNGGGRHAVWSHGRDPGDGHPTQKPVALMSAFLADFTDPGETVLDPFMGSGTTLVACQRMGRSGIGVEIDPKHFDTACRRVEAAARQSDLFPAALAPHPSRKPGKSQSALF